MQTRGAADTPLNGQKRSLAGPQRPVLACIFRGALSERDFNKITPHASEAAEHASEAAAAPAASAPSGPGAALPPTARPGTSRRVLYCDPGATLDDVREAVTTLEEIDRAARRVLGGAHPTTTLIEDALQDARAALRAHETPPSRPPAETI